LDLAAVFEAKSSSLYVLIDRNRKLAGTQEGAGGERAPHLLRNAALDSGDGVALQSSSRRQ
jgi:hypothetical protein